MSRAIMHLDMNSYFASVEQAANPALKGKPVVVIGAQQRTVILTASYEARNFGIKTGMMLFEAKQLCPGLILVPADNRKYTDTSARITKILLDYTPLVETFSVDEAFLDLTGSLAMFGSAEQIAWRLKSRIKFQFDLTCSIGIAPNKLLAKLASEMQKPDGLTDIRPEQVPAIMERTPVGDLCGIGRKLERQLHLLGIRTCGQLGRYPVEILRRKFGVIGDRLHLMGKGIDESPVIPAEKAEEVKSVGHSTTLREDLTERDDLLRVLLQLSEMVGRRARRYDVAGKTVHVTVRFADFTTIGRQETYPRIMNQSEEIYRCAVQILDSLDLSQPIRLLGVRITNLCYQREQLPLFEAERRQAFMVHAMDTVNNRYGDFTVTFGSLLAARDKGSHVISPAWRPSGIRNVAVT